MVEHTLLQADLDELLTRLTPDGYVRDARDGQPNLISTLFTIPTLGERDKIEETTKLVQTVLDARDEEGGWDDPWATMLGVEALVALQLRNIRVDGVAEALDFAVNALRSAKPLAPMERELRLSRALILAGMAKQDPTLLDAGILRIHGLLDTSPKWSTDMTEGWHGLLSLADLLTISKDESTRELIKSRIDEAQLDDVSDWGMKATECVRARAGIVMFKLGHIESAQELLVLATQTPAKYADTVTLKHRIELAARLESIASAQPEDQGADVLPELSETDGAESNSEKIFTETVNSTIKTESDEINLEQKNLFVRAGNSLSDPDRSLAIFEGLLDFWLLFPQAAPDPEVQNQVLLEYAENLATVWTENNRPLVSLILMLDQVSDDSVAQIQQLVDNTIFIPFELLVSLPQHNNPALDKLLTQLGALHMVRSVTDSTTQALNQALIETKAPYVAAITLADVRSPGWLKTEFSRAGFGEPSGDDPIVFRTSEFDPTSFVLTGDLNDPEIADSAEPKPVSPADSMGIADILARADALIKVGDYGDAENTLVNLQPMLNGHVDERVTFWTLLGDARFRQDRAEEAYKCYRKAVDDNPAAERAWIGIGTYHMINDEMDDARSIFSRIVELNPVNQRGHLGLGNVYLKEEKPADAIPYFKEALRLDPRFRHAVVGLVAASVQAEKMADAVHGLVRYLDERPEDVEVRFHLAAIYFGTSQAVLAREHATEVLRVKPAHHGAQQILAHLAGSAESS
jgi:tetratricopeptide (TPR) repeat protein